MVAHQATSHLVTMSRSILLMELRVSLLAAAISSSAADRIQEIPQLVLLTALLLECQACNLVPQLTRVVYLPTAIALH